MRKPQQNNIVDASATKKPYVTDDMNEMEESVTNKEIEDKGGVTKHSEFEKPYRLNYNQNYMDMQTQHPSNFEFPYDRPRDFDGSKRNEVTPDDEDKIILPPDILSCLQTNTLDFCLCAESLNSPILQQFRNQKQDEICQQSILDAGCACPEFTLTGGGAAPTDVCISSDAAGICADPNAGNAPNFNNGCMHIPNTGCGSRQICITDICGVEHCTTVTTNATGSWFLVQSQGCGCTPAVCEVISGNDKYIYSYSHCCGAGAGNCQDCHNAMCGGCSYIAGSPPCDTTPSECNDGCAPIGSGLRRCCYIYRVEQYEWRC